MTLVAGVLSAEKYVKLKNLPIAVLIHTNENLDEILGYEVQERSESTRCLNYDGAFADRTISLIQKLKLHKDLCPSSTQCIDHKLPYNA